MSYSTQSYEDYLVPGLFAPWAKHLVEAADPQEGEHALDVACGTGIVARTIAPRVGTRGTVIGLDVSPDMIEVARARAEVDHLPIDWRTGPAEQLPFPDEHFDLVLCQFGLMFFTDRSAALKEMHRVLKAGGRLLLSTWQGLDRHPFYLTLHDVSQRHFGKSSVETVFSMGSTDELAALLRSSGFARVQIKSKSMTARFPRPGQLLAWELDVDPAAAPALKDLDPDGQQAVLDAARREMQSPLDAVMQDDQAILEFHANIARAER